MTLRETACPQVRTVSSAPREECVISSQLIERLRQEVDLDLQASKKHTGQPSSFDFVFSLFSSHKVKRKETAGKQPPLQKPKLQLPRQHAATSGAATPGFLGPFPSYTGVFGTPPFLCTDAQHAVWRVPLCCGSWVALSLGCQPGSSESVPCVTWSVFGSPPLRAFHHCPVAGGHSPRREVVSGPGCPPHGFWATCIGS